MTRKEMYKWLEKQNEKTKKDCKLANVYYLVTHDGITEAVNFIHYTETLNFIYYNEVYFECECVLNAFKMTKEELDIYIENTYLHKNLKDAKEYEYMMYRDGIKYEIESYQSQPWLEEIDDIKMISELECLEWLLKNGGE